MSNENVNLVFTAVDRMSRVVDNVDRKLDGLGRTVGRVDRGIDRFIGRARSGFNRLNAVLQGFGVGVGFSSFIAIERMIGRLARAIPDAIGRGEQWADTVRTLQSLLGGAAERASTLAAAAHYLGVSQDEVVSSLQRLIREGASGEQAYAALTNALGLTDEQLRLIIRDAQRAGLILDQSAIDAAARWEMTRQRLDATMIGVGNTILSKLAPTLDALVGGIAESIRANLDGIVRFAVQAVNFVAGLVAGFLGLDLSLRSFSSTVGAVTKPNLPKWLDDVTGGSKKAARGIDATTSALEKKIKAIDREIEALDRAERRRDAAKEREEILADVEEARRQLAELKGKGVFTASMTHLEAELARQKAAGDIIDGERALSEAKERLAEHDHDQAARRRREELEDQRQHLRDLLAAHKKHVSDVGDAIKKIKWPAPPKLDVKGIDSGELSEDLKTAAAEAMASGKQLALDIKTAIDNFGDWVGDFGDHVHNLLHGGPLGPGGPSWLQTIVGGLLFKLFGGGAIAGGVLRTLPKILPNVLPGRGVPAPVPSAPVTPAGPSLLSRVFKVLGPVGALAMGAVSASDMLGNWQNGIPTVPLWPALNQVEMPGGRQTMAFLNGTGRRNIGRFGSSFSDQLLADRDPRTATVTPGLTREDDWATRHLADIRRNTSPGGPMYRQLYDQTSAAFRGASAGESTAEKVTSGVGVRPLPGEEFGVKGASLDTIGTNTSKLNSALPVKGEILAGIKSNTAPLKSELPVKSSVIDAISANTSALPTGIGVKPLPGENFTITPSTADGKLPIRGDQLSAINENTKTLPTGVGVKPLPGENFSVKSTTADGKFVIRGDQLAGINKNTKGLPTGVGVKPLPGESFTVASSAIDTISTNTGVLPTAIGVKPLAGETFTVAGSVGVGTVTTKPAADTTWSSKVTNKIGVSNIDTKVDIKGTGVDGALKVQAQSKGGLLVGSPMIDKLANIAKNTYQTAKNTGDAPDDPGTGKGPKPMAMGAVGIANRPFEALFGEAGSEAYAILRNPRAGTIGELRAHGGRDASGPPVEVTVPLQIVRMDDRVIGEMALKFLVRDARTSSSQRS